MRLTDRVIGLAAVALLAWVASSCSEDPTSASEEYVLRGDAYLSAQKYAEAIIEYRNAAVRTPGSARVYHRLGDAYANANDARSAYGAYARAVDLDPGLTDAQLKAGGLLLRAGAYEDARTRARAVLATDPQNSTALLLLGKALAGLRSFDEAIAANQRAVELAPSRPDTYVNLGSLEFARGNEQEAEEAFRGAVAAAPASVDARVGLAAFLRLTGKLAEAEEELRRALALDPQAAEANRAMAAFLISTDRPLLAEPHLRKVADLLQTKEARFALIDYYAATGRFDQARRELAAMLERDPGDLAAMLRKARVASRAGDRGEAARLVDEILGRSPREASTLAFKAHLLLGERRLAEALEAADAAVAANPESAPAHFARATALRRRGQADDARRAFGEVLRIDARAVGAMVELAQLHLAARQIDTALGYAEQAVAISPGDLETHLVLARVLTGRPEGIPRAERIVRDLITENPASARLQIEAGRIAQARSDWPAAIRAFSRAAELDRTLAEPIVHLASLELRAGRTVAARRIVAEAVATHPDSIDLLILAARIDFVQDPNLAERALRQILQLDPSHIDAYQMLGSLYLRRGQIAAARAEFIALAAKQPKLVGPPTMAGVLSAMEGDGAAARHWYERALQINPRAAAAANNLAWIYAERGENLEIALQLAQGAHREVPGRADVLDTLGWVYYKKGLWASAVRALKECVELAPANPIFHYHLGLAHAKNAEDARARASLQTALKLDPKFPHAADARRVLQTLLY